MIVGDLPQFTAVSIGWHDDVNDAREEIEQAIERVRGEEGVLLLTDMFGGTPSNLGMTFLEKDRIEVITGVNLPDADQAGRAAAVAGPAGGGAPNARRWEERHLGRVGLPAGGKGDVGFEGSAFMGSKVRFRSSDGSVQGTLNWT